MLTQQLLSFSTAQNLLDLLESSCKRKGSILNVLLQCDDRINKRDFIHGVMNQFGIDSSVAIRMHHSLSKVYNLFRDDKSASDVRCLDFLCVFQSIIFIKTVRDNPRKVILDLISSTCDMRKDGIFDCRDFCKIILCASVCKEEKIDLKVQINEWIIRLKKQGRDDFDLEFICDILDLIPKIEITFRDNILYRLNHRNKMILMEEREVQSVTVVTKTVQKVAMTRFVRTISVNKLKAFREWKDEAMQSSRGKIFCYRMLYWKVHKLILFWHRQTISTKRCNQTSLVLQSIRLNILKRKAFHRWKRFSYINHKIRRICLEQSDIAKKIAFALSKIRVTTTKYYQRLYVKIWIHHITTEHSIISTRACYNIKILKMYMKAWKTKHSIEKAESYKRQVKQQLSDIMVFEKVEEKPVIVEPLLDNCTIFETANISTYDLPKKVKKRMMIDKNKFRTQRQILIEDHNIFWKQEYETRMIVLNERFEAWFRTSDGIANINIYIKNLRCKLKIPVQIPGTHLEAIGCIDSWLGEVGVLYDDFCKELSAVSEIVTLNTLRYHLEKCNIDFRLLHDKDREFFDAVGSRETLENEKVVSVKSILECFHEINRLCVQGCRYKLYLNPIHGYPVFHNFITNETISDFSSRNLRKIAFDHLKSHEILKEWKKFRCDREQDLEQKLIDFSARVIQQYWYNTRRVAIDRL